jgi:hypothetical protein
MQAAAPTPHSAVDSAKSTGSDLQNGFMDEDLLGVG